MAENKLVDLNGLARYNEHIKSEIISSIENIELKVINGESIKGTGNIETIGKLYPDSTHGEIFNEYSRNVASGDFSHAEGNGTTTNNVGEHAEGQWNLSNTGSTDSGRTIHSVGIGTGSTDRRNAHEIMANGNHYIIGIGNYDGTNYSDAKSLQQVVNSLEETASAAYPGDKGKQNADNIATLQTQVGSNNFSSSNYLSKETNLTDAVLQLDEEVKATNDNLALEHANAEATYAKKTELGNYLPLTGGTMNQKSSITWDRGGGEITTISQDSISINDEGSFDNSTVINKDEVYVNTYAELDGGEGTSVGTKITVDGIFIEDRVFNKTTINKNGITLYNGNSNKLLNSAGGTTYIRTIGGESMLGTENIEVTTDEDIEALFI